MNLKVEILPGINPKEFFPDAKFVIIYGFTIGDRHYFRFDDSLSTGYDRALKALVYYRELDMNTDREFLKFHTEAVDNIFTRETLTINDLMELKTLNNQLKQRLELPKEPDLMLKLASVVFFDQYENPQIYEFAYGERKIKFWKKNTSPADFFLSLPLKGLIPYLQFAGENLLQFSEMTERATKEHLDKIYSMSSPEQKIILKGALRSSPQHSHPV